MELSLLPGFKIGLMIPDLNSVGKVPVANDSLKRVASCVDMWRHATVSSKGDIKSGPDDFMGSNCDSRHSTSEGVTGRKL